MTLECTGICLIFVFRGVILDFLGSGHLYSWVPVRRTFDRGMELLASFGGATRLSWKVYVKSLTRI